MFSEVDIPKTMLTHRMHPPELSKVLERERSGSLNSSNTSDGIYSL